MQSPECDVQGGVDLLGLERPGVQHEPAWTKNSEAAQLTSMPIIILVSVGPMTGAIPAMSGWLRDILSLTPGAAMADLVRLRWFGLTAPGPRRRC